MDYLPYALAFIGVCLAAYGWQRSVHLALLSQRDKTACARPPESASTIPKAKRKRPWLPWILLLISVAVLLVGSFYLDAPIARLVKDHADSRLRTAGGLVSHYGDWPEHAGLGVALWLLAYLLKSRRWQRIVLMMILASVLGGLTADVVRGATGRPRPSTPVADGWYGPHLDYKYNAFPSGHAAASTAFFGVLLFVEWPIGALVLIFPIAVGVARLLVNAHHFSDIVGSAIIGVVAAYAATRILRPRSLDAVTGYSAAPSPLPK